MPTPAPHTPSRRLLLAAAVASAAWPALGARRRVVTILGDSITAGYGLAAAAALRAPVASFFEGVRVMADDRAVRENRVRLLRAVANVFAPLADFGRIQVDVGGGR